MTRARFQPEAALQTMSPVTENQQLISRIRDREGQVDLGMQQNRVVAG